MYNGSPVPQSGPTVTSSVAPSSMGRNGISGLDVGSFCEAPTKTLMDFSPAESAVNFMADVHQSMSGWP